MTGTGTGSNDHSGATVVDSPTELDVLAVHVDHRVESIEFTEQVRPDEHHGRRDHEHVAHPVVLLLVDLAGLDRLIDLAEAVESEANAPEHARVVPFDELRTDDTGVGAVQLLDEQTHRVAVRGDVIVAEEEEAVLPFDEAQYFVGGGTESGVHAEFSDEGVRQATLDGLSDGRLTFAIGAPLGAIGQQEQKPQVGVVLVSERVERLFKPMARLVHDDDGHDGRGVLSLRFHDLARLALRSVWNGSHARSWHASPRSVPPTAQQGGRRLAGNRAAERVGSVSEWPRTRRWTSRTSISRRRRAKCAMPATQ